VNHYRQRSPEHLKLLGKKVTSADQDAHEDSMAEFAKRERQARLPAIKKADQRVAKYRKAQSRGR
jgi:hypothetical protein